MYIQLRGIKETIEVQVEHGRILFKIPSAWEASKYVVYDSKGNKLVEGIINRIPYKISSIQEYELTENARRKIWFYLRKLHQPEPRWMRHLTVVEEKFDILIDRETWIDGRGPGP